MSHETKTLITAIDEPLRGPRVRGLRLVAAICLCGLVVLGPAAGALAAASPPAPAWAINSLATPTNFLAADNTQCLNSEVNTFLPPCDRYTVTATNAGDAPTDGSTVTLTDTVPAGLTVQAVQLYWSGLPEAFGGGNANIGFLCTTSPVQCQLPTGAFGLPPIGPDDTLRMEVVVTVSDQSFSGQATNAASVSGGAVADASTSEQHTIGSASPGFGIHAFSSVINGVDGQPDTQASGRPYELRTRLDFNNEFTTRTTVTPQDSSVEDPKDVVVDLPLGFLGSALAAPQCALAQLSSTAGCPADTRVGQIESRPELGTDDSVHSGIFNMVPERGVPAEFGYIDTINGAHALYGRVVPTPAGYVLRVTAPDIPQVPALTGVMTAFFGDPAVKDANGNTPSAFFTNPSVCDGQPLTTTVHIDSWQHPGRFNPDGTPDTSDPNWVSATSTSPPVHGCNQLSYASTLSVQPDTTVADSPSGLTVDVKVPQSEDPNTLATPPLRDASVTLPTGFTVNPSSAAGLQACMASEIALGSAGPPSCPQASKIGTVELTTPLIPGVLQGEIYLASEFDNPFHSLLAGYLVVDDPTTGVVLKIPGNLTPDPVTGQITGVFDNNPQFPFSDLELDFKGGPAGVLATPESCGTFFTSSIFSPWSFPDSGPAATPSDSFSIDSGCVSGFSPSFTAGVTNPQARAYSPFVVSLQRSDTDQNFSALSVTLPPGMLAKLAGVQECSERALASISSQPGTGAAQAANPSCPAGSQVGTVSTGAGTGPDPFFLSGTVYLTGPYNGAPYGLAVVVPAAAGPLDLGTVVVRQALYIDPTTAQVTAVSDPFPTILDGIPLRLRRVDVTLGRPQFTVNPTSCDPMAVTGTALSTGELSADVTSRFEVGDCQALGFSPKLAFSLTGRGQTHSGNHPTLTATLTQPGGQANIRSARVALPLSLALDVNNSQHVCNYDVAQAVHGGAVGCPASTIVGQATAQTPLLDRPLTGPVYLVQGIRFGKNGQRIHTLPSLLIPLRGQIALDLRASSAVNGAQQLVTTFSTIPDAPVSKFTLQINGGRKGILVITGRGQTICGKSQVANAQFAAQSGSTAAPNPRLATPACAGFHHSKRHSRRHGRRHARRSRAGGRRR
jgi:hypothetical protein